MPAPSFRWAPIAALAVLAAIAGAFIARQAPPPAAPTLAAGTWLPQARRLPEFALLDQDARAVDRARLEGAPTILFFGFTHCPDVCPNTLAMLASLRKAARVPDLRVALVSVDPERDTPEQLRAYLRGFDGQFIGITGSAPAVERLTRDLGVAATKVELPGGQYTVDHSSTLFLLDSKARLVAVFTPPFQPDRILADLDSLADRLRG